MTKQMRCCWAVFLLLDDFCAQRRGEDENIRRDRFIPSDIFKDKIGYAAEMIDDLKSAHQEVVVDPDMEVIDLRMRSLGHELDRLHPRVFLPFRRQHLEIAGDIAGADKKFVPAYAEIRGDEVIVTHPKIKNPAAVRYAWADNPECNLYSDAGLPVSPFRSDSWPEVTVGKK